MKRTVTLLLALLAGCSSPSSGDEQARSANPAESPPLAGVWVANDPEVGTLRLEVSGDDLQCVLTDARGTRYEFEAEPDDDGRFEVELEPEGRGLQILICRPETSLEVAGSMNYAKGVVVLSVSPAEREGQQVAFLEVHRPDRREDTLRGVNLLRQDPQSSGGR